MAARAYEDGRLLVAGGTSGTGLATAEAFARAGVRAITLVGRNAERGETAKARLRSGFPDADIHFVSADANIPDDALRAADAAATAMGGIDYLVNGTVSSAVPELFHLIPIEEMPGIVNDQMMGPILMCRAVMPYMREQNGGVITNIASDAGKATTPGESVIGAAMAGIIMLTRTLAMEAKRNEIRVNAITPSLIDGTLSYDRMMSHDFSTKLFSKALKMAHLGLTRPDDLAELIVFLSGPLATRITGQIVSVNGGISA